MKPSFGVIPWMLRYAVTQKVNNLFAIITILLTKLIWNRDVFSDNHHRHAANWQNRVGFLIYCAQESHEKHCFDTHIIIIFSF